MSYNGSGVYTLPGAQLTNGSIVSATENNQLRNDMAAAFNVAWTRDGQAPATADIPMNSFKFTELAAGTSAGDSVRYEQVTSSVAITGGTINGVTIGGSTAGAGTFTTLKSTSAQETQAAVASTTIDLSTGNYFTKTISGSTTFTVSNVPSSGTAFSFILDLTNAGASVTWWSGVDWAGGTSPTLTTSGRDSLGFYTYDGGATWNGFVLGKDMK